MMIREQYNFPQWGVPNGAAPQMGEIRMISAGLPLKALFIASHSVIDCALAFGGQSIIADACKFGVKMPYFVNEGQDHRKSIRLSPYQYFTSVDMSNSLNYLNWGGDGPLGAIELPINSLGAGGQVSTSNGDLLAIDAYYGDYPRVLSGKRDTFQRDQYIAAVSAGVTTRFRQIVVGRERFKISTIHLGANLPGLVWTLYGCTETANNYVGGTNGRRTQLATGTGKFDYAGPVEFDAIEVDLNDPAFGADSGVDIRFSAWD